MTSQMETVRLADGRDLDVLLGGAPSGPALVCHHGTPSDASLWCDWDAVARERGLQLLAISRPGYASSTRRPGRCVADVTDDVGAILDRFDVTSFVTIGWSGGGPHALACGARLAPRCRAVATLAGVAPWGAMGLDWLDGMGAENHAEFGAALAGEATLRTWLFENGAAVRHSTGPEMAAAFGGLASDVDKESLVGEFADCLAATMRRALASGFDGWIDDDLAFTAPWGFVPADLGVPVAVWQGDLDFMVPAAHGRWLTDHIPRARARRVSGQGHISLFAGYRDEIVRDLMDSASR